MKKKLHFLVFGFLASQCCVLAQSRTDDSLQALLQQHPQADTIRVKILNELAYELRYDDPQRCYTLVEEASKLSARLNYPKGEALAFRTAGVARARAGDYTQGLVHFFQAVKLAEKIRDDRLMATILIGLGDLHRNKGEYAKALGYYSQTLQLSRQARDSSTISAALRLLGVVYNNQGDFQHALDYYLRSLKVAEQLRDNAKIAEVKISIGYLYAQMGDYSKALAYQLPALRQYEQLGYKRDVAHALIMVGKSYHLQGKYPEAIQAAEQSIQLYRELNDSYRVATNETNLADIYDKRGEYRKSLDYGLRSLSVLRLRGDVANFCWALGVIARAYLHSDQPDSARFYGWQSLQTAQQIGHKGYVCDASRVLAQAYARVKDFDQAYRYQEMFIVYKDSLTSEETSRRTAMRQYSYDLEKKQAQIALLTKDQKIQAETSQRQRQLLYGAGIGLVLVGGLVLVLYRSNRHKQHANILLTRQKQEINSQAKQLMQQNEEILSQRDYLEQTLDELKDTQTQLIQQEKMASLGELTAGIAHEIQNPLNFVNNFSEMSSELVEELKEEWKKEDGRPEMVAELFSDLQQNLAKIHHHGQRADSIVKAMLQHSRASSGEKQLTDLNALVEEYLRLSYHGLRAKNKDFNATLTTDLDAALGKVAVVSQDIGRVLLNLFNNAFYATQQKKQWTAMSGLQDRASLPDGYQPEVKVSTKKVGNQVEIRVRDNGTGMPEGVKEKIFQPFFTTKPTGQGTGLGLSLSYDVVNKGHRGELKVETQEGEFSEFVVRLPILPPGAKA